MISPLGLYWLVGEMWARGELFSWGFQRQPMSIIVFSGHWH